MNLSRLASAFSFFAAFLIGIAVGLFFDERRDIVMALESPGPLPITRTFEPVAVSAEDLVGVWKGTWGYNRAFCTIEIDRIEARKFYGTLKKGNAEIAIAGTIDLNGRTVSFRETKVLDYGEYSQWSLGKNSGAFSADGRTLTGTGTDKWGTYGWDASKSH
jgi:hypothetical protein